MRIFPLSGKRFRDSELQGPSATRFVILAASTTLTAILGTFGAFYRFPMMSRTICLLLFSVSAMTLGLTKIRLSNPRSVAGSATPEWLLLGPVYVATAMFAFANLYDLVG